MLSINRERRFRLTGVEYRYDRYTAIRWGETVYVRFDDDDWHPVTFNLGEFSFNSQLAIPAYLEDFLSTFFGM